MFSTTLKPGWLVSCKTKVVGGVQIDRRDLPPPDEAPEGASARKWETTKIIDDPEEHERAEKLRSTFQRMIRGCCIKSEFGLLCPATKAEKLDEAVEEAQQGARDFNATARVTRIDVNVIKGWVADSDEKAARAIVSEIRGLFDGMDAGIKNADPVAIRDAAKRALSVGKMLDEQSAAMVTAARKDALAVATALVKRVQKGGEVAATVVDEFKLEALKTARFAFLDMDAPSGAPAPAAAPVQAARMAGLDMDTAPRAATPAAKPAQRTLELAGEGDEAPKAKRARSTKAKRAIEV